MGTTLFVMTILQIGCECKEDLSDKELMLLSYGAREGCWESLARTNQSVLKEINPEYSLEGLVLKLKLRYFGHLKLRAGSLEKTLMLGKIEGWRRRGQQRLKWLDAVIYSVDMNLGNLCVILRHSKVYCAAVHWVPESSTWWSNWTTKKARLFLWCV